MADYKYTPADFKSDQEVRWCPGCGDHAILSAVQRALPEIADALDTPHNLFTFVSGIGCSSRFIYYMKTYGFHSVHGRANAVATGVKTANPRPSVWGAPGAVRRERSCRSAAAPGPRAGSGSFPGTFPPG